MKTASLTLILAALLPSMAMAHTPLCSCYDFGDNTILCEGGFSDGSSAAGVELLVLDASGNELIKSEMNQDGEFEFQKPSVDYKVLFNAGPGHSIEIDGKEIVE
jgi:hypothetical protein